MNPRSLHGQIVETLAVRVLSGEWREGTVLNLPALREELDISLTALREALKVLTAKGLIHARQKHGTFVQPRENWQLLDPDVMRWHTTARGNSDLLDELAEVRAVVEPAAARLAAERATAQDIAAMSAALDAMSAAPDTETRIAADLAFHRGLLTAAHNGFLLQIERVIAIGLAERDRLVHRSGTAGDATPSHRAVLDAVTAHDAPGAEAAMLALLTESAADASRPAVREGGPHGI